MKRFWFSWYESPTDDYRPLKVPPDKDIPGYWCSGWANVDAEPATPIMCAVINAKDEDECQALVRKFWEPKEWRFCEEKDPDWIPGDRFPMS